MKEIHAIKNKIFREMSPLDFNEIALKIFYFQYKYNPVYKEYVDCLSIDVNKITNYFQIPFLPIEFFKTRQIITGNSKPEIIFSSSGTTGMELSNHFIVDAKIYDESLLAGFKYFYGDIKDYLIAALLPSYKEDSSLIYMVKKLIEKSENKNSGY